MSRRKQAKPQHLSSDEDSLQTDVSENALLEAMDEEEGNGRQSRHGSNETHVCEKCCAEFFSLAELAEHQSGCTTDPLVLIVKEDERIPRPVVTSPAPSFSPSDPTDLESTDGGFELANDSSDMLEEREDESMELEQRPQDKHKHQATSLLPPDSTESISPQISTLDSYSMPTTNVTLEILQSTRVAVAQFSQGGVGGKGATAAIPVILEHLLALQQQQVHQLQLIEQIRSQVAVMNKQPTQMALNPVSRALSLVPNPFTSQSLFTTSVLPVSGTMPSAINGQASVSLASLLERSQMFSLQTACGHSSFKDVSSTSTSSEVPAVHPSSCSDISTPPPLYAGACSGVSSAQTPSSSGPLAPGQSSLLGSPGRPFLPQSPPSSVIFPNPLASIAATAKALDPLAALMKHRKGKPPNVSVFDTKPSPEEPFFKHKCRFCAKVFGSDSALQIHLRSHTGERPFKCNICGNRFSTKGNLKVHFQRHKEKYPHVQMNPYPVPEYLDNVPTSSGIPYGMSFPSEKQGSTWLDSKPVLATMPTPMSLQLPSTLTNDFVSVMPSIKSPYRPASSECVSLSPKSTNTELNVPPASESPQPKAEVEFYSITKAEEVHLPQIGTNRPRGSPVITVANTSTAFTTPQPSAPASPASDAPPFSLTSDQVKARFPFGGPLDSMQTSETSKLQQLVENIDRKIADPNQCVLCHRVLSCQSALKMHYRIHTGERPFKCKVCGRAFTTKGNLKTHFGVHRANPPLRVQHSCPICQKRFTNAVVLQQHIRMHMGGHIPDSPVMEGLQEVDPNPFFDETNADSLSSHENDFMDDNSMEDDDEEEEVENMEDGIGPFKPLTSLASSPPASSAVVSSIAALQNQMKMIDSTVSLNHSFGIKSVMNGFVDSERFTFNCTSLAAGKPENHKAGSPTASESSCSMPVPASPAQSTADGLCHILSRSPEVNHREEFQDILALVKNERADSPTQDPRGTQPNKPSVKKESPYSMMFLSRECGPQQSVPSLVSSTAQSPVKTELNGHSRPTVRSEGHHQQEPYSLQVPAPCTSVGSPGLTSLLAPAPPRRTPKQHNCNACGKNFSSASALQIHERTHTGEKPFGCSICGRAFTTKGNLKVHMGTHMWNNAPARRGRRLSVENPMALLGGEAMKLGEMFQKDLAARAMNMDAGFWNRYAAAITNGLAMKNNEISVIQNGGIAQLHTMTAGMERMNTRGSPPMTSLGKTGMELGVNRHFSMLIDDSKEIGIN